MARVLLLNDSSVMELTLVAVSEKDLLTNEQAYADT
jgi:hypothetical protein